jgi:hypothetical protein
MRALLAAQAALEIKKRQGPMYKHPSPTALSRIKLAQRKAQLFTIGILASSAQSPIRLQTDMGREIVHCGLIPNRFLPTHSSH